MHRAPQTTPSERANAPLVCVYSDVHGPMDVRSRQGHEYWVFFLDCHSRLVALYSCRTKAEVFATFKTYRAWAENQMNRQKIKFDEEDLRRTIRTLRDDKGGEYTSNELKAFCDEHGISREHTIRDSPEQNGVAEQFNRTLQEGIKSMLAQARLPHSMWVDAAKAFVHIYNRTPSSTLNFQTPYELWNGHKPSVAHLRVWGCLAFVHLQKDQRSQLAPNARRCIFIGYPEDYKGWRFWDPERRVEVISDSAEFAEDQFPGTMRGHLTYDIPEETRQQPPPNELNTTPQPSLVEANSPVVESPRTPVQPLTPPVDEHEADMSSPGHSSTSPRATTPDASPQQSSHPPILLRLPGRLPQPADTNNDGARTPLKFAS
jgi:hypothetical protein